MPCRQRAPSEKAVAWLLTAFEKQKLYKSKAGHRARQIKVTVRKPGNLSPVPRAHTVKGKNWQTDFKNYPLTTTCTLYMWHAFMRKHISCPSLSLHSLSHKKIRYFKKKISTPRGTARVAAVSYVCQMVAEKR